MGTGESYSSAIWHPLFLSCSVVLVSCNNTMKRAQRIKFKCQEKKKGAGKNYCAVLSHLWAVNADMSW